MDQRSPPLVTIPWISPKVMTTIHAHDSNEHVSNEAVGNGTRLVPKGSVLVMVRGMGLHQGVRISQAQCDVTFNQDVKALVPSSVGGTFLLFAILEASQWLFSKVQASGHGTGVLPTDIIESLDFIVPHLSLNRNSPTPREVELPRLGKVVSTPHVGGLHHRYSGAA